MRIAEASCFLFLFAATIYSQSPTPTPSPEPIRETVIVVADRMGTSVADTPASVDVISRKSIETTASVMPDDVVRQSVGFSTFRRTSGRSSNPTTQGVSFRGIGSSGASRAAVLFDGVPLNDPFGGWVQWERVPLVGIEQIEVLRGGASSLYGNYALSGAIDIIPRKPVRKHTFSADVFAGSQRSLGSSAFGGFDRRNWKIDATVAAFQTRGSKPIDQAVRGLVDSFAGVRYTSFLTRIGRNVGKDLFVFARPTYFGEVRTNGTGLQTNRTHIRGLTIGGSMERSSRFRSEIRLFGGTQGYDQIFSVVNAVRTDETLNRIQRVPSQNIGGSIVISGSVGRHSLVGGVDLRAVRGSSDEVGFVNRVASTKIGSSGRDTGFGVFLRDVIKLGDRTVLIGGLRIDRWRNSRGSIVNRSLSSNASNVTAFPDRDEMAFSPQLAMLYTLKEKFSVYFSGSSSFRSPTLNELYRSFRVGNVNTLANADLRAERAVNFESGVTFRRKYFGVRTSAFYAEIDRPIANVTLTTTPTLITRQRQNMGRTRSLGFEAEFDASYREFSFSVGYQFVDPTVIEFAAEPTLIGRRVPQVARDQATFQVRYYFAKWTFVVQGRASSEQFDDDQNQFRLEPYAQIDTFISYRLKNSLSIFAAVENISNSRYSTGKTPIRTVSSGSNLRAGIRWN